MTRHYEGTKIADLENQCLREMVKALPGAILASDTFAALALQRLQNEVQIRRTLCQLRAYTPPVTFR